MLLLAIAYCVKQHAIIVYKCPAHMEEELDKEAGEIEEAPDGAPV